MSKKCQATGPDLINAFFVKTQSTYGLVLLGLAFILGSCVSTNYSGNRRKNEDLENLKGVMNTGNFRQCKIISDIIELPAPIRDAKILWDEGKPVLVYEGMFRNGTHVVWQPLKEDYSLSGDGIKIGLKTMEAVSDVNIQSDSSGLWFSYRFKGNKTEVQSGAVEWIEKQGGKVQRIIIPTGNNLSVQQMWLLPPASRTDSRGLAHIIVRTSTITFSSVDKPDATYTWYAADMKTSSIKKMGEYKDRAMSLAQVNFVLRKNSNDPIALAMITEGLERDPTQAGAQKQSSKIVAVRMFVPANPITIYEDTFALSALVVMAKPSAIALAWLRDPRDKPNPTLLWSEINGERFEGLWGKNVKIPPPILTPTPLPLSASKAKKAAKRGALPAATPAPSIDLNKASEKSFEKLRAAESALSHAPTNLQFLNFASDDKDVRRVIWWASTETDAGVVIGTLPREPKVVGLSAISEGFISDQRLGSPVGIGVADVVDKNPLIFIFAMSDSGSQVLDRAQLRLCAVTHHSKK